MKPLRIWLGVCAGVSALNASDDFLDRVEQALTISAADSQVRARLSGTLELEGYRLQLPTPGLIQSTSESLFVPRLSMFLDAQFGPRLYAFLQARVDRGFDATDNDAEMR